MLVHAEWSVLLRRFSFKNHFLVDRIKKYFNSKSEMAILMEQNEMNHTLWKSMENCTRKGRREFFSSHKTETALASKGALQERLDFERIQKC